MMNETASEHDAELREESPTQELGSVKSPASGADVESAVIGDPQNYSDAKARLDEIVKQVRAKDVSLERSLDLLEEGVKLANQCTELIDQTRWEEEAEEESEEESEGEHEEESEEGLEEEPEEDDV